jgi:hypothetical protein
MANIAISALPVAASQAGADVLPIVQATTSTTKQLSVTNLFTSPTFVTPALGTVASGVISACTSTGQVLTAPVLGTVASGNISACTSTSMVMVTPVLGTPTSGNLSNLHQHLDGIDHTSYRRGYWNKSQHDGQPSHQRNRQTRLRNRRAGGTVTQATR